MKTFLFNAAVFVGLTFLIDAYWFNGRYYGAFFAMVRQVYQHLS